MSERVSVTVSFEVSGEGVLTDATIDIVGVPQSDYISAVEDAEVLVESAMNVLSQFDKEQSTPTPEYLERLVNNDEKKGDVDDEDEE